MLLTSPTLRAQIEPAWGGGLVRFDGYSQGRWQPLMRAVDPALLLAGVAPDPNRLACYPLVPWSNRISGGGFELDGRRIEVPLTRDDEPWPIHGTGWRRPWRVTHSDDNEAMLAFDEESFGPYRYHATLHYLVRGNVLYVVLDVINTGAEPMPFGLGLHPFFPRDADTRLHAPARKVWRNDGATPLPIKLGAIPKDWRFDEARALPGDCIDHGFVDWSGEARIHWPSRGISLDIHTDVDRFVMYTPVGADFFCFEPVDHAIDAVNLPGGAVDHGMTLLEPGESLQRRFSFTLDEDASG